MYTQMNYSKQKDRKAPMTSNIYQTDKATISCQVTDWDMLAWWKAQQTVTKHKISFQSGDIVLRFNEEVAPKRDDWSLTGWTDYY